MKYLFLILLLTGCSSSKFNKNDVVKDSAGSIGIVRDKVSNFLSSDDYIVCYKFDKVTCFVEKSDQITKINMTIKQVIDDWNKD